MDFGRGGLLVCCGAQVVSVTVGAECESEKEE